MSITAATRLVGVVGRPVRHSLSPVIHNAWIRAAGLDAVYVAFAPEGDDGFRRLIDGLRGQVVLGLNVTLPFKEEALSVADRATDRARRAGAANLLRFGEDGSIEADNTDGLGLTLALEAVGWQAQDGPAVLLGAGGAARGAALALADRGVPEIVVVNRTLARAAAIARLDPRIRAVGWAEADAALQGAAALVNATSLGMTGQPPLELDLSGLPGTAVVMDMVYRPLQTRLLRQALQKGCRTAGGLAMLIGQAGPSFEAFFGRPPPAGCDVRALCEAALG
jgi:shikimate dehydrogenase